MLRTDDVKTTLLEEALLLGVLSRLIQDVPEKEWLDALVKDDVFADAPLGARNQDMAAGLQLLQAWSARNREGLPAERLTELNVDHTRLFVGVGQPIAPPWESVYFNEDRMVFQQQTLEVRRWYQRFGLESEKLQQEPDDHIGLELSFLAYLAGLGLQAAEKGEQAKLDDVVEAQRQFIAEHPLKWVEPWSVLVEKHAGTDFYRGLAQLIRGVVFALAAEFQASDGRTSQ